MLMSILFFYFAIYSAVDIVLTDMVVWIKGLCIRKSDPWWASAIVEKCWKMWLCQRGKPFLLCCVSSTQANCLDFLSAKEPAFNRLHWNGDWRKGANIKNHCLQYLHILLAVQCGQTENNFRKIVFW